MMQIQDCKTADEVVALARQVRARRREMFAPKPKPAPAVKIAIAVAADEPTGIPVQREQPKMSVISMPEPAPTICPSVAFIIDIVSKRYGVGPLDIKSARRTRNIVIPRMIVAYLARRLTVKTMEGIGKCLGNRDHTTILHAVRTIEKRRRKLVAFDAELRELEAEIPAAAAKAMGRA